MDNVQIVFHPMMSEFGGSNPVFSPTYDVSGFSKLIALLAVQDVLGTSPSLTVEIQESMDGQIWRANGSGSLTAVGTAKIIAPDLARFVRAKYAYSGTDPRFTFSVLAVAREL